MGDAVLKTTTTTTTGDGPDRQRAAETEPEAEFAALFGSTPRGARLARRVAVRHLAEWGHPADSDLSCTVALLVAELAGNAVRHGRVPGRDFRLRLALDARRVRVEVSDASSVHPPTDVRAPAADDVSGRGLVLVDALADRWGVEPRPVVGKTVWAEAEVGTWAGSGTDPCHAHAHE
ncbi:ATP-binding protein [Streptomyces peucetius]|uniref:ATP-binding protein n=1 Tax=Streptomyces peucetius TaxID=1950 RepID=A0ABY6I782_STRPE|nr:ATP-binding protein [Streptomyces peucetius]UYQ62853.1 ATP-binding protein [Streptomyces peucetius]